MTEEYKILFVDDDLIERMAFERFVKREEVLFKYHLADSLKEAMKIIKDNSFDVIITDFNLGDGNAFDLIKSVKDIPFIVVTGLSNHSTAVKVMKAGAYDYIVKDSDSNHFQALPITVEKAVERKRNEDELKKYRQELEDLVNQRTSALIKEIDERKKAEKELRKSEEKYRQLTDSVPVGIYKTTRNGKFLFANPGLANILGYDSVQEVLQLQVDELYLNKEEREFFINPRSDKEIYRTETLLKRKDGTEIWVRNSGRILYNESRKAEIFDGVLEDITDSKLAEEAIKKLNEELEGMVAERTVQLTKALNDLKIENRERAKTQKALEDSLSELKVLNTALANESDKLIKLNSKLVISEANLKDANAAKDRFFSIIGHDLKNPMQSIMASVELMKLFFEKDDKENLKLYIDRLQFTMLNIRALLENLLTWARSQSGSLSYEPKTTNICLLLRESLNFTAENAHKKNITTEIVCDDEESLVAKVDNNMLSTVMRNLLFNAIKFTPENGHVIAHCEKNEKFIEISIIDSGIGIAEEDIDKLFKIDVQHTTLGTSKEKGTGLGLIICKEFIDKHQGKIWVESKPGSGSKFSFTLPL